jgi:putative ABC transport system permease protein
MPTSLKLAVRSLRRSLGFASIAVLILAIGIGATTAMFSVTNTVLLKPLPYRQPEQLISILFRIPSFSKSLTTVPVNAQHYQLWRDHSRTLQDVGLIGPTSAVLSGVAEPERITGARVSANFFRLLGASPSFGRSFAAGEDEAGHGHVVIVSDDFWRSHLGARADVIGQKLLLDGEPYQLIGVMPNGFLFPRGAELSDVVQLPDRAQYWTPLVFSKEDLSSPMGNMDFVAIARLRPEVTARQAAADLAALEKVISKRFPQPLEFDPVIHPLQQLLARRARLPLIILMAAVASVLLIICINILNLMMVRAISKRREWAIELALGARTRDVVLGALSESFLLALPALALGVWMADWLLQIVRLQGPASLPRMSGLHIDSTALFFAMALSAASAIVFGIWPAWRAANSDPQSALQSSGRGATEGRSGHSARRFLVAAEVALSTVLLLSACLLLRSFATLLNVNPGVKVQNLSTARVALSPNQYKTDPAIHSFYKRLVQTVSTLPGVEAAGVVSTLPVTPEDNNDPVTAGDRAEPPLTEWPMVHIHIASSGYFRAAGIALDDGSVFEERNGQAAGILISKNLADQLWPRQSAVGRPLEFYSKHKATIAGVVGAVRATSLTEAPGMDVYIPDWVDTNTEMSLVVRTAGGEANLAAAIRRAVHALEPQAAVRSLQTMREIVDDSIAPQRFQLYLLVSFAVAALALASLGIYGVLSFATARRTTEIGIRMALGARPAQILTATVQSGLTPVVIGIIGGLCISVALAGILQRLLFEVRALDPLTYILTAVFLLFIAAVACLTPAKRAARLSPLEALRHE